MTWLKKLRMAKEVLCPECRNHPDKVKTCNVCRRKGKVWKGK